MGAGQFGQLSKTGAGLKSGDGYQSEVETGTSQKWRRVPVRSGDGYQSEVETGTSQKWRRVPVRSGDGYQSEVETGTSQFSKTGTGQINATDLQCA